LEMLITSPQPKTEDLGRYYESEDYISHTDSKRSVFDKVYQIVKNHTIKQKLNLINSFQTEGKNILDIGCGTGDFISFCQQNEWNITGVEPNVQARNLAFKKLNADTNQSKLFTSVESLLKDNNKKYDVITMWHVLEHIPNLEEYISYLKQLLKPNGTLVIAVPNYKSYDAKHYGKFWAAFDVPRHLWHFSKISIQKIFLKFDLELVRTLPMKFDSYYVSLLSEKYKSGSSNPLKAFYIGFVSNLKAKRSKEYSSLIYMLKNTK
ncbi:MAG: class I SAM-dependent methyltransferase, partial [Flavobacteriaceae bacterium]|nr:class I SAM-dependent methyltransferase [Flavobacteriaceae bacterium]